jgi:hypothetical protein
MATFLYLCEYLGTTPKDFFDLESTAPTKASELLDAAKGLDSEQLDYLIAIAEGLKK